MHWKSRDSPTDEIVERYAGKLSTGHMGGKVCEANGNLPSPNDPDPRHGSGGNWNFCLMFAYLICWWVSCAIKCMLYLSSRVLNIFFVKSVDGRMLPDIMADNYNVVGTATDSNDRRMLWLLCRGLNKNVMVFSTLTFKAMCSAHPSCWRSFPAPQTHSAFFLCQVSVCFMPLTLFDFNHMELLTLHHSWM